MATNNSKFSFFKENDLDRKYEILENDLITKYRDFLMNFDFDFINYYKSATIVFFVQWKKGLDSEASESTLERLHDLLNPVRVNFIQTLK